MQQAIRHMYLFYPLLNVAREGAVRGLSGKLFHAMGPVMLKAAPPSFLLGGEVTLG